MSTLPPRLPPGVGPVRPSPVPAADNPWRESVFVLGRWVRGQILIAVSLTIFYAVCFGVARVPWWPVIAVIGGIASVIPRVGGLIPIALASLAILLAGWDWTHFLIALGGWTCIQALEGFFLTPHFLGKPLGLKPWIVFVAVLAGSFIFGPLGLLLAVPVLAVAGVFYRYFRQRTPANADTASFRGNKTPNGGSRY